MMTDKQIEDMAKVIADKTTLSIVEATGVATILVVEDYRKASDVVEKIFVEIEKALDNSVETEHFKGTWFNFSKFKQRLAELKKKYEILNSWEEPTHTCQVEIPHTIESIADLAFPESENE